MERNYEVLKLISSWGSGIDVTEIYAVIRKSLNFPVKSQQPKIAPTRMKTDDNVTHLIFTTYFDKYDKQKYLSQRDQLNRIYNKIFDTAGISFLRYSEVNWYLSRIYIDEPYLSLLHAEEDILCRQMKISVATIISVIQVHFSKKPLDDIDLLNRTLHWVYTGA